MSSERTTMKVGGVTVQVVRKPIKNLHLGVYPPNGRVRVAAPLAVSNDAVRLAVVDKLAWVNRQRKRFANQPRQTRRGMVPGETHFFLGRSYRLGIVRDGGPALVVLNRSRIEIHNPTSLAHRKQLLESWYRSQLKALVPALIEKWEPKIGAKVSEWGVRKMKTRWGSCNSVARRIWLNLELVKKSAACLEYLVVHEMVHLLERSHNARFTRLMDRNLPGWELRRKELNAAPLVRETWTY